MPLGGAILAVNGHATVGLGIQAVAAAARAACEAAGNSAGDNDSDRDSREHQQGSGARRGSVTFQVGSATTPQVIWTQSMHD